MNIIKTENIKLNFIFLSRKRENMSNKYTFHIVSKNNRCTVVELEPNNEGMVEIPVDMKLHKAVVFHDKNGETTSIKVPKKCCEPGCKCTEFISRWKVE